MNRTTGKWLLILVGVLLATNMLMLFMFVLPKGRSYRGSDRVSDFMVKQLKLDSDQQTRFMDSKDEYFRAMRPLWDSIRISKDSLYRLLGDPSVNDSMVGLMARKVAERTRRSEEMQFSHFMEVRKYCTPEQQKVFDTLIPNMLAGKWGRSSGRKSARSD